MPTLVSTFGIVAVLSILSVLWLIFGTKLPAPIRNLDGRGMIGFTFLVYYIALVSLGMGVLGWAQVRNVVRSRYKYLFSASALIIVAFVGFVSFALYSLSHATDL